MSSRQKIAFSYRFEVTVLPFIVLLTQFVFNFPVQPTSKPTRQPTPRPITPSPTTGRPTGNPTTLRPTTPKPTRECTKERDFNMCFAFDMSGSVCNDGSSSDCDQCAADSLSFFFDFFGLTSTCEFTLMFSAQVCCRTEVVIYFKCQQVRTRAMIKIPAAQILEECEYFDRGAMAGLSTLPRAHTSCLFPSKICQERVWSAHN